MVDTIATPEYLRIGERELPLEGKVEFKLGKYDDSTIYGFRKKIARDIAIKEGMLLKHDAYQIHEINQEFIITRWKSLDDPEDVGKINSSKVNMPDYSKFLKILIYQGDERKNQNLTDMINDVAPNGISARVHYLPPDPHCFGESYCDGVEISYTNNHKITVLG